MAYEEPQLARRQAGSLETGGCRRAMAGCLIALAMVGIIGVGFGIWAWWNWRTFSANLATSRVVGDLRALEDPEVAGVPTGEVDRMVLVVETVRDAYIDEQLDRGQAEAIANAVFQDDRLEAVILAYTIRSVVTAAGSPYSPVDRVKAKTQLARFARGVAAGQITDTLPVRRPVIDARTGRTWSRDELTEDNAARQAAVLGVLAAAEAAADGAGVPNGGGEALPDLAVIFESAVRQAAAAQGVSAVLDGLPPYEGSATQPQ